MRESFLQQREVLMAMVTSFLPDAAPSYPEELASISAITEEGEVVVVELLASFLLRKLSKAAHGLLPDYCPLM